MERVPIRIVRNRERMSRDVKGVPEGASVVIPRLFCRDPVAEIEFCTAT
jgi:PhnB protein